MATKVLGTVALISKGIWTSGTYNKYEYVYDTTANATYVALKDNVTIEPSGNGDGINWNVLCKGIGVTTDNNFTDIDKQKVSVLQPAVLEGNTIGNIVLTWYNTILGTGVITLA